MHFSVYILEFKNIIDFKKDISDINLRYKAHKEIFKDFFKLLEVPGSIIQIKNLKMINTIEFTYLYGPTFIHFYLFFLGDILICIFY